MERDTEVRTVENNIRRVVKSKMIEEKLFGDSNHRASVPFKKFQESSHIVNVVERWRERTKTFYAFAEFELLED